MAGQKDIYCAYK